MPVTRSVCLLAVIGLLSIPGLALAQGAPAAPPQQAPQPKSIGQPAQQHPYQSLIVMNARGATLQGDKLVLTGVSPNSIVFADRPVRAAGHVLTTHVLEEWTPSPDGQDTFAKNPPNAT